ncbi:uncharacterized protein LOC130140656 [Syzygium oleosum]|uniref:uncharacterized protein LOC130140656 n=1 Tax=Syzygium oleosum TaxID=219896 RepID=UPI0024BAA291|nr:uncharacterized protein LOC130140656 [Syzygium oleosum]
MEGMSSHLKELWEGWELRALVLLSLTIQVLLIILGRHRKYRPDLWLKALVWSCYLAADAVAIYALGKIATRLKQMRSELGATAKGLDPDAQMTAFWAPFLLLHLGGPDTITAYALEDNELWMRHLLGLLVQTTGTLFIFFQALTGSDDLTVLSLLMFVSGLIKYGERVYVLRAASSEQFRDSIPDPPLHYSKILEEYTLKEAEGYDVTPHEVIEVRGVNAEHNSKAGVDLSSPDVNLLSDELKKRKEKQGKSKCSQSLLAAARGTSDFFRRLFGDKDLLPEKMKERNRAELAVAEDLINIFQRLFADLVLSFEDRDTSMLLLEDKHFQVVFRVIEIELGLMYNKLYTKAMVIHNKWGFTLRSVSVLVTVMVLVLFSRSDKDKYSKLNIYVTFLLLGVAILLEIYALFVLLFSDEAACWLKDNKPSVLNFVERLQPLYNRRRWSGSMAQYNLLSFALKEKHLTCHPILERLHVDQKVLKFLYRGNLEITDYLKGRLLKHFKSQAKSEKEVQSVRTYPGYLILKKHEFLDDFKWSIELEFDQSIYVWHIATELLCHPKDKEAPAGDPEMSKQLSRYMMYLLVMYPFLLPVGVGRIRFRGMYATAMRLLKEPDSKKKTRMAVETESNILEACNELRTNVNTELAAIMAKGDKSKFALYQGCRLASQLNKDEYREKKWDIISNVWVEMLVYAAVKCKGVQHARQLRRGGEFLTHVWFLMAHFGLTDHFQIPYVPAIAELLVKQD